MGELFCLNELQSFLYITFADNPVVQITLYV